MGTRDVSPIPEGYHAVTPFVVVKGAAQFLDFMRDAFGAEEIGRVQGEDGAIGHAETRIGDSVSTGETGTDILRVRSRTRLQSCGAQGVTPAPQPSAGAPPASI